MYFSGIVQMASGSEPGFIEHDQMHPSTNTPPITGSEHGFIKNGQWHPYTHTFTESEIGFFAHGQWHPVTNTPTFTKSEPGFIEHDQMHTPTLTRIDPKFTEHGQVHPYTYTLTLTGSEPGFTEDGLRHRTTSTFVPFHSPSTTHHAYHSTSSYIGYPAMNPSTVHPSFNEYPSSVTHYGPTPAYKDPIKSSTVDYLYEDPNPSIVSHFTTAVHSSEDHYPSTGSPSSHATYFRPRPTHLYSSPHSTVTQSIHVSHSPMTYEAMSVPSSSVTSMHPSLSLLPSGERDMSMNLGNEYIPSAAMLQSSITYNSAIPQSSGSHSITDNNQYPTNTHDSTITPHFSVINSPTISSYPLNNPSYSAGNTFMPIHSTINQLRPTSTYRPIRPITSAIYQTFESINIQPSPTTEQSNYISITAQSSVVAPDDTNKETNNDDMGHLFDVNNNTPGNIDVLMFRSLNVFKESVIKVGFFLTTDK